MEERRIRSRRERRKKDGRRMWGVKRGQRGESRGTGWKGEEKTKATQTDSAKMKTIMLLER